MYKVEITQMSDKRYIITFTGLILEDGDCEEWTRVYDTLDSALVAVRNFYFMAGKGVLDLRQVI